jgi:hypothetical protein
MKTKSSLHIRKISIGLIVIFWLLGLGLANSQVVPLSLFPQTNGPSELGQWPVSTTIHSICYGTFSTLLAPTAKFHIKQDLTPIYHAIFQVDEPTYGSMMYPNLRAERRCF